MITLTVSGSGILALVLCVVLLCATSMWNVWNIVRHK